MANLRNRDNLKRSLCAMEAEEAEQAAKQRSAKRARKSADTDTPELAAADATMVRAGSKIRRVAKAASERHKSKVQAVDEHSQDTNEELAKTAVADPDTTIGHEGWSASEQQLVDDVSDAQASGKRLHQYQQQGSLNDDANAGDALPSRSVALQDAASPSQEPFAEARPLLQPAYDTEDPQRRLRGRFSIGRARGGPFLTLRLSTVAFKTIYQPSAQDSDVETSQRDGSRRLARAIDRAVYEHQLRERAKLCPSTKLAARRFKNQLREWAKEKGIPEAYDALFLDEAVLRSMGELGAFARLTAPSRAGLNQLED